MKIAFFDTKNYDIDSFAPFMKERGIEVKFFEPKLSIDTIAIGDQFIESEEYCNTLRNNFNAYACEM